MTMDDKQRQKLLAECAQYAPAKGRAYEMHVADVLKGVSYFKDLFQFNRLTYCVDVMRQLLDGDEPGQHVLSDADVSALQILLQRAGIIGPTHNHVGRVIESIAWNNPYDPLIDHMEEQAAKRDGVDRFHFGEYIPHCDGYDADGNPIIDKRKEATINKAIRVWFLQLAERWRYPGTSPAEFVIIFVGKTGINKSRFGQVMVPNPDWFTSNLPENLNNKDALMLAGETPLIEMGEVEQLMSNRTTTVWNFLSIISDKFRMPYGKNLVTRPRRCVFFGGSNPKEILKSTLGNRRLFPIEVDCINFEAIARDYDQLLAQALHELREHKKNGTEWRVVGKLYDEFEEAKAEFFSPTYLDDRITDFLRRQINAPVGTSVPIEIVEGVQKCRIGDMWFALNTLVDEITSMDNTLSKMKAFKLAGERLRLMGYDTTQKIVKAKGIPDTGREVLLRVWHRKDAKGQLPYGNVDTVDFYPASPAGFDVF